MESLYNVKSLNKKRDSNKKEHKYSYQIQAPKVFQTFVNIKLKK